jgi:3-oxoacyl-[acyl-carrier protein] reductase
LFDHALDLNVKGSFMCCKYAVPGMLERKKGVIVNIASAAGVEGGGGGAAYTCSKHAVIGLTMQITAELGKNGIRANTVCPGLIKTGMVTDLLNNPDFMTAINGTPAGRVGTVEDTTSLILFLASDESSYIHGDTILIDGGLIVA